MEDVPQMRDVFFFLLSSRIHKLTLDYNDKNRYNIHKIR